MVVYVNAITSWYMQTFDKIISSWSTQTVLAFVAIAGLIFSIYKAIKESKLGRKESESRRFTFGVEVLLKLDDRFNEVMLKERRRAAQTLLREPTDSVDSVLDFFETLGLLARKEVLDEEVVWHTFFHWIRGYWQAAKTYVIDSRQEHKEPERWKDFEWLYNKMVAFEKTKSPNTPIELSKEEITKFLEGELEP